MAIRHLLLGVLGLQLLSACSSAADIDGNGPDGALDSASSDTSAAADGGSDDGSIVEDTTVDTAITVDSSGPDTKITDTGTASEDSGPTCAATVSAAAIPLSDSYLSGSVIGSGGYTYAFDDKLGSSICLSSAAVCAKGTTAAATTATVWGAGFGVNLHQAKASGPTSPPVEGFAASGVGIAYAVSNLPSQGLRLIIDSGGVDYCAPIITTSGTIVWNKFNTKCWDGSGSSLSGAPATAKHVQFQIVASTSTLPFDFCVTSLAFATSAPSDAGVDTGPVTDSGAGGACMWSGGPTPGSQLTCYYFSQGSATGGGCPSYKTYCGYCGSESGSAGSGACPSGIDDTVSNISTGTYFAAIAGPGGAFAAGKPCGACVDVSFGGKTITATIIDACATCVGGLADDLDLSLSAARALGIGVGAASGHATSGVTWKTVSCPVSGDIVARFNAGYTGQIYFQNVRFPVAHATSGAMVAFQANGYWDFGAAVAGKTVTLEDGLGHTITGTIPSTTGGSIGAQFPATCM